jgi:hypothetical protein
MTARNGFAAAIAAEVVLEKLLPHLPEQESGQGTPPPAMPDDADLRAALRQAAQASRDTVRSAEADLDGLTIPLAYDIKAQWIFPAPTPPTYARCEP